LDFIALRSQTHHRVAEALFMASRVLHQVAERAHVVLRPVKLDVSSMFLLGLIATS